MDRYRLAPPPGFRRGGLVPIESHRVVLPDRHGILLGLNREFAGEDCSGDAINQTGAKHVGFAVDDVEAFYEDLPADVEPIRGPQSLEIGTSIPFFTDPDGNFVEVVEASLRRHSA